MNASKKRGTPASLVVVVGPSNWGESAVRNLLFFSPCGIGPGLALEAR